MANFYVTRKRIKKSGRPLSVNFGGNGDAFIAASLLLPKINNWRSRASVRVEIALTFNVLGRAALSAAAGERERERRVATYINYCRKRGKDGGESRDSAARTRCNEPPRDIDTRAVVNLSLHKSPS